MKCFNCGNDNSSNAAFCNFCGSNLNASPSAVLSKDPDTGSSCNCTAPIILQQGRYIIHKKVGSGGMGRVFLAKDTRMNCEVVVKEMHQIMSSEETVNYVSKRFEEEARMLFRLKHAQLPKVTDYFKENNNLYMAMEFVEGENLEHLLKSRKKAGATGITFDEFMDWFSQALDILKYLHHLDPPLIHRDIKPANLMLNSKNQVFLVDFGIARAIGEHAHTLTSVGTFGYASPEHFSGKFALSSDIYSLGATFHFLLTAVEPHDRDPFKFPPLSDYRNDVPAYLQDVFDKMLAQDRNQRYENVDKLIEDFELIKKSYQNKSCRIELSKPVSLTGSQQPQTTPITNKPQAQPPQKKKKPAGKRVVVKRKMPLYVKILLILLFAVSVFAGIRIASQKSADPVPVSAPSSINNSNDFDMGDIPIEAHESAASEADKTRIEELFSKGETALRKGSIEDALIHFTSIIELDDSYIPAYFQRALIYQKQNDLSKAMEDANRIIELDPNNKFALMLRGKLFRSLSQFENALDDFEQAAGIDGGYAPAYLDIALTQAMQGNKSLALQNLNKAVEIDPMFYKAYKERGTILKEMGDFDGAINDFTQTANSFELKEDALLARGIIYYEMNDITNALSDFKDALKIDPEDDQGLNYIALCYIELEQYDEAENYLNKLIKLYPDFIEAYNNLGLIYYRKKDYDSAIRKFSKALKSYSGDTVILNNRGLAYHDKGEKEFALKDYNMAIQYDPSYFEPYINRGVLFYEMEDFEAALDDFNKAIHLKPDFARSYVNRGDTYTSLGDQEKARLDWLKVVELNNDEEEVKKALERLESMSE